MPYRDVDKRRQCHRASAARCKDRSTYKREYRKAHEKTKFSERSRYLRAKYGLSLEDVDAMLIKQEHKCRLCGEPLVELMRRIDHNHTTGIVRGILCQRCNIGLSYVEDINFRTLAIKYLKEIEEEV